MSQRQQINPKIPTSILYIQLIPFPVSLEDTRLGEKRGFGEGQNEKSGDTVIIFKLNVRRPAPSTA